MTKTTALGPVPQTTPGDCRCVRSQRTAQRGRTSARRLSLGEYRKIKRLFHRLPRHPVLGSARTPHAARPERAPPPAAPAADQHWMQQASRGPAPPRREPGDREAALPEVNTPIAWPHQECHRDTQPDEKFGNDKLSEKGELIKNSNFKS